MRRASLIWSLAAVGTGGAIALLAALPYLAADRLAAGLAGRLAAETGLTLTRDGAASASWLPRPRMAISGPAVAQGDRGVVARAGTLDVEFDWQGLLRGRLDIARLDLRQVRLAIAPAVPAFDIEARSHGFDTRVALTSETVSAQLALRRSGDTIQIETLALRSGVFAATGEGRLSLDDGARLALRLDRVTRQGMPYGSFAVAGSYGRDGLLLERATFRRPDGAELSLFGHAVLDGGTVRLEGGIEAGAAASGNEAAARLSGTLENGVLQVEIADIDGRGGGGRLTGSASLGIGARARLAADLRIDRMDIPAASTLLLAMLAPIAMVDDAELRLRAGWLEVAGSGAEGVIVDITGREGAFELRELAIRALGGAPLRAEGSFSIRSDTTIDIARLAFRHGAVEGSGRAAVDLSGARPKIDAELATAPLTLEPVFAVPSPLPPEPMTRRAAAAAAVARQNSTATGWSRERFTLPLIPPVDARLIVTTPRLTWRSQRLDNVRLILKLDGDGLDVDELSGAAYGGQLAVKGRMAAQAPPQFRGTAQLVGADLRLLFAGLAGIDALTGRVDVTADLSSAGDTAAELISTLSGEVRLAARDGAVGGFDLPAVGDRLKRMSRPTDLIELARAGSGGRTPFQTLDGTFRIERGVARTDGVRLAARGGEARLRGTINLPAWTLDLVNELAVTEPPGLPPLAVRLSGPIAAPRSIFDIERLQAELLRRFRAPAPR